MSHRAKLLIFLTWLLMTVVTVALFSWQVMVIGVIDSIAACLWLCVGGTAIYVGLIVMHELGHFLAGWMMGLPFLQISLGPLQMLRDGGRLFLRPNTAWFKPVFCAMHDLSNVGDQRVRYAVFVLGGPLANLLLAAGCLIGAGIWNPAPLADMPPDVRTGFRKVALLYPGDLTTALLNVSGIMSLYLGLSSFFPVSAYGLRSDGGILLDLWRGKFKFGDSALPTEPPTSGSVGGAESS